jgi:DNA mismatch repair protein PMS2
MPLTSVLIPPTSILLPPTSILIPPASILCRLIRPLPLALTAADELVVIDHLSHFKRNGFEVEVVEGSPPTQRLRLRTMPFSKHTLFGVDDVHELVALLAESPGAEVTLPKLRDMYAMRACRGAIMIGTALEERKMRMILDHLAVLDQPWNCPHGRPTLRHLVNLDAVAGLEASSVFEASRMLAGTGA